MFASTENESELFQPSVWATKIRKLKYLTSNHSLSHSFHTYCEAIFFLSDGLCTVQYSKSDYSLFVSAPNVIKWKRNYLSSCQIIFCYLVLNRLEENRKNCVYIHTCIYSVYVRVYIYTQGCYCVCFKPGSYGTEEWLYTLKKVAKYTSIYC